MPTNVIVDGTHRPTVSMPCEPRVKADAHVQEVMVASICAKVLRDRLMQKYHRVYPQFGFDRHKGYGTNIITICYIKMAIAMFTEPRLI